MRMPNTHDFILEAAPDGCMDGMMDKPYPSLTTLTIAFTLEAWHGVMPNPLMKKSGRLK